NVGRCGKCSVDSRAVTECPTERHVAGSGGPELRRTGRERVFDQRHGRQWIVVGNKARGHVLSGRAGFRDAHGDRLAHMTYLSLREHRPRRFTWRTAVGIRETALHRNSTKTG